MIHNTVPKEPTSDECNIHARVKDQWGRPAYAIWYPQMGGYSSKCVVVLEPLKKEETNLPGGCFEAFVWHDGEFPFDESDDIPPAHIHHCDAEQFIEFGKAIMQLEKRGVVTDDELQS